MTTTTSLSSHKRERVHAPAHIQPHPCCLKMGARQRAHRHGRPPLCETTTGSSSPSPWWVRGRAPARSNPHTPTRAPGNPRPDTNVRRCGWPTPCETTTTTTVVRRLTRQHSPYPPLALSPLGHPIARGQRATTQSLPCVRAHIGHPVSCLGHPSPGFQHPCPPRPPHTHPRPPKVNCHVTLNHVTFARLFLIPRALTGSPATSVPPHSA